MKILSRVAVLLLLILSLVVSPALGLAVEKAMTLEEFLDRVEKESAAIDSFSSDFRQVRHLAIFPSPVEFSGRLILSRPDRLRWEFREPLPSVLVLNGKKGMKCSGEGPVREFSLDNDPVMRMVSTQLWAWTSGSYRQLGDIFNFELLPGPVLVMTPLNSGAASFIDRIRVLFDPVRFQPLEVEISEPGGEDRTVIHFSAYQHNIRPEDGLFSECRRK
jgi:outer membrane lipoprotein-sorting protein